MTDIIPTNCFQSWDLILFRHQHRRYVEHLFVCEICRVHNGLTIVQVNLSHDYCWFHCYRHEHSPNHRMFFRIFCNNRNSFLSFSHLIIHPIHEWSWFYWQFQFCFIVSNDELLRPCPFLRIDIGSPRSVTRHYLIHNGLRSSIMKGFLVRETRSNFSCRSPRSFIGSPRSLVHLNISFPLLRRPSTVVIPLWVACWREAFHELLMIIVIGSFHSVYADIRSPWSLLFLSNCTPGILISITSLLRACWSRGRYVRRRPGNKIHHRSQFCCDSFFTWIVLRSFRHCFRAHCGTEMADIEQAQQMIPLITREIFLVKMSASWFLVSMYLIWIFGSKLIRSNKQSSATLWVLETCLIVGLLPLRIILITASLSSNTYNKASWREDWTFEGTESMFSTTLILLWDLWCLWTSLSGCPDRSETWETLPKTETIRSHKSTAGSPSDLNPASKEMISDSVQLCETEACFLHIQLTGTNVWLPKMHNLPPEVDFESSRSPAKSESWNNPSLHRFAVLPT